MISLAMLVALLAVYWCVARWTLEWSRLARHPWWVRLPLAVAVTLFGVWVFAGWVGWSVLGGQDGPLARARAREALRAKAITLTEAKTMAREDRGFDPDETWRDLTQAMYGS